MAVTPLQNAFGRRNFPAVPVADATDPRSVYEAVKSLQLRLAILLRETDEVTASLVTVQDLINLRFVDESGQIIVNNRLDDIERRMAAFGIP